MSDETVADVARTPATAGPPATRPRWRGRHLWLLRRLVFGVLTLAAVSMVVFLATTLLPGDAARAVLGPTASPAQVAALRGELGLDEPVVTQYLHWTGRLISLDLGRSLAAGEPVSTTVGWRAGNSLTLLAVSALVSVPLSVAVGAAAALRPRGVLDGIVNAVSVTLAGLPEFVTALVLVMLFSTTVLPVLPAVSLVEPGSTALAVPEVLVLPVATLTLAVVPYLARLVRASLIEALDSDYVMMARLKGLSPRVVLLRHALRNGLVPAIQGTALSLAYLLGGVVIVEYVFQYPGLGSQLQTAVNQRDLPVIQAIVLLFAACYVLFNLIADVLTAYFTPRLRTR
ncbi:ABC transporter permease [Actinomadura graeca]|uniref:ABC transporter permease n=1 Tax=Actinomadura graeca TaxID=2750812 RepID=A0ABX8QYQ3_9ACTN|nr:ABC transporter permease [Actinomadura graeca]QXJ22587.1 ABC transporter permease [Actinomadura graeca]